MSDRHPEFADQFASYLARELSRQGKTLLLSSSIFDAQFGSLVSSQTPADAPRNGLVVAILHEQEVEHDHELMRADSAPSEWTDRCIRQADRVLVIHHATEQPSSGPIEERCRVVSASTPRELVLVHPPETSVPEGTARYLDPGRFQHHHHIRNGDERHLARLARRLGGQAVGLVLSGGGAADTRTSGSGVRSKRPAFPVDFFGGTSMGALLSAAFAMGIPYAEGVERSRRFAEPKRLFDYTLPFASLFRSRKLKHFLHELYGDLRIEDLWLPYFCIATDLSTADRVVFRQGPLWAAIRASISIPGVFVPVVSEGRVLVDGGVIDNLPVKQMAELLGGPRIVAVNVAPHRDRPRHYDLVDEISGWRILWNRLNPFSARLRAPSLVGTIMRSLEVNSARASLAEQSKAAVLIEPDVRSIGILDFKRFLDATEIGYRAAVGPVEEWRCRSG
ncbi:MAG: hypothetical protein HC923_03960 [Myxococcales bacterium]|nr:hypothetical protein [Myxococcales bacterium]